MHKEKTIFSWKTSLGGHITVSKGLSIKGTPLEGVTNFLEEEPLSRVS